MKSGAVISLTDAQTHQVGKYIEDVIFGTPAVKEKRAYVKRGSKRAWTKEEDEMIKMAMQEPLGKPRHKAYKFIAANYKRTRGAISQRAGVLRRDSGVAPVEISTGYLGR